MKKFLILTILTLTLLGCASKGHWVKNGSSDLDKEQATKDYKECLREGWRNRDRFEHTTRACMEEKGYSWREKVD